MDDTACLDGGRGVAADWVNDLRLQLDAEVRAMMRHALANGLDVPPPLMNSVAALDQTPRTPSDTALIAPLAALHAQLVKLVAPARPGTLRLLHAQAACQGPAAVLGPLVNLRRLTLAAFACTALFVGLSLSPLIDATAMSGDLYSLSGLRQLVAMLFLLAAAGMGSTFQALFTAQSYASKATYDPVFDGSYWVRIGLGLVAGLMLSVLVPLDPQGNAPTIEKPLLALLGGFSASLVHRILQRLVDSVGSLFDGDPRALLQRDAAAAHADARQALAQSRIDVASQLVGLRDQLAQGASSEQLHRSLSQLLDQLLARGDVTAVPIPPESHSG